MYYLKEQWGWACLGWITLYTGVHEYIITTYNLYTTIASATVATGLMTGVRV